MAHLRQSLAPTFRMDREGLLFGEPSVNMGLWFYAENGRAMKTTVEVSDDLYRRAKAEAALRGRKLKDLVEEGLRLVLEASRESHRRRSLAALMKGARGAVDSGIPDLASNPEYLTGFGHDARRHR